MVLDLLISWLRALRAMLDDACDAEVLMARLHRFGMGFAAETWHGFVMLPGASGLPHAVSEHCLS